MTRRFVPDRWGGTEQVVSQVSKALRQGGVESTVFCTDMLARPGEDEFEDDFSIIRFNL